MQLFVFRNPQSSLCHINQQRLSAVLGAIVFGFIISYGPFYISQMLNQLHYLFEEDDNSKQTQTPRKTMVYMSLLFQVLTYLNSCINPILYSSCTRKFMLIKELTQPQGQTAAVSQNHQPNVINKDKTNCNGQSKAYMTSELWKLLY